MSAEENGQKREKWPICARIGVTPHFDSKQWPKDPKTLSDALKRLAPSLRERHIFVVPARSNGKRWLELTAELPTGGKDSDAGRKGSDAGSDAEHITGRNSRISDASDADTPIVSFRKNELCEFEALEKEPKDKKQNNGKSASLASLSGHDDTPIRCVVCGRLDDDPEYTGFRYDEQERVFCSIMCLRSSRVAEEEMVNDPKSEQVLPSILSSCPEC